MTLDLRLYLVTDPFLLEGRDLKTVVRQAVEGGVTLVQLREKNSDTRNFYEKALALKACLRPYNVPLIINDRLDIALAVDAEGLHIGQNDLPWEIARQWLGPDKWIGLSVENVAQARLAGGYAVDYIGISPVFSTPTKLDTAQPFGLEGIKLVKAACPLPAVAIGGIHAHNVAQVLRAGADGVAVVSAILGEPHPAEAARKLKEIITSV